jgi:hypothetical protein
LSPEKQGRHNVLRHHQIPTDEQGWLEAAVDEPVEVVLDDGQTVVGVLRGNDEHTIVVETGEERSNQLIYKRQIRLLRR